MAVIAAPVPPRGYLDELEARVLERTAERSPAASGARREPLSAPRPRPPLWLRIAPFAAAALVAITVLKVTDLDLPGSVRQARAPADTAAPPAGAGADERARPAVLGERKDEDPKYKMPPGTLNDRRSNAADPHRNVDRYAVDHGSTAQPPAAGSQAEPAPPAAPAEAPPQPPGGVQAEGSPRGKLDLDPRVPPSTWGRIDAGRETMSFAKESTSEIVFRPVPDVQIMTAADPEPLRRAESWIGAGRLAEAQALVDSLLATSPPAAVEAGGRFLAILADEVAVGPAPETALEGGGKASARRMEEVAGTRPSAEALMDRTTDGPPSRDIPVRRDLVTRYARVAEEHPRTRAGREAAARAALIAVELGRRTRAEEDCAAARRHSVRFLTLYAGDARADSLRLMTEELPCPPN
jgi:hypothetical protein